MNRIARVPIMKTQLKKLKPVLDKANQLNDLTIKKHNGFIIIGQVEIPDNVNELDQPVLKVVLLTGARATAVIDCVDEQIRRESNPSL